jgi:hypothetical protein
MKFQGCGIVWDRERNKPLCRFVGGELETDDSRICTTLKALGYEGEGEQPEEPHSEPIAGPKRPTTTYPEPHKPDPKKRR